MILGLRWEQWLAFSVVAAGISTLGAFPSATAMQELSFTKLQAVVASWYSSPCCGTVVLSLCHELTGLGFGHGWFWMILPALKG
jgi:hypothetical protein